LSIPAGELAIWIDPIGKDPPTPARDRAEFPSGRAPNGSLRADSTNEYIRGDEDVAPEDGIYPAGLRSALVLVGAYERRSGCPVLGVINEPFFRRDPLTR
ncbi:INPP phosphatase, partial [Crypturellus undulatus]|nr:INPP phosphatase [Crypturellus undulatus]